MEEKMRPDLVELHYINTENKKFQKRSENEISEMIPKLLDIN